MTDWAKKRSSMDAALKRLAVPLLRSQGFKGSFPHFRMAVEDHIRVIGFQFSQWGPQFYIELGVCGLDGATFGTVHYDAEKIKYYQTHFRQRIGDNPFDYGNADPNVIADDACTAIKNSSEAWEISVTKWRNEFRDI